MKKILAVLLVAAMVLSLCVACGKTENSSSSSVSSSSSKPESSEEDKEPVVNKYGWEVPEETISLTYFAAASNANQDEKDSFLAGCHEFFLENFNIDFNCISYLQDDDGTTRLQLMISAGDYPECIAQMSDSMAELYISQGRARELTGLLEEYAPSLLAGYGNYINLLKSEDGGLYKLASRWGNTTDQRGSDFAIRYDYFLETGMDMFNSLDTYYEVIKAILANHPVDHDGQKTYGMTSFTEDGYEYYQAPLSMLGFKCTDTGFLYKTNEDGTITHWIDTDEGLRVSKYINQMYREQIIDPQYITRSDEAYDFMQSGRVVGNIGIWWHVYVGCNNGMQEWCETNNVEWDPTMWMVNVTFQEGDSEPCLINNNYIRQTRLILTDKCTDEQAVNFAKYFEWEAASPFAVAIESMGPDGGDCNLWWINDEGQVEINDLYWYGGNADNGMSMYEAEDANGAFNYWLQAPAYQPQNKDASQGWAAPCGRANFWDPIVDATTVDASKLSELKAFEIKAIADFSPSYLWDQTLWTMSFAAEDERNDIIQNIKDNIQTGWALIMQAGSEAECEVQFYALREKLHNIGLDTIVEAQQEIYQQNVAKYDGTYWD